VTPRWLDITGREDRNEDPTAVLLADDPTGCSQTREDPP
jgi:hypothetical protein